MDDEHAHPVVIVDDDEAVRDSFRFLLETAGFSVLAFPSGHDFLRGQPPRPRCLIVDHHMPDMTGLELVAELRQTGSKVPVLLITADPSPTIIDGARKLGVRDVMEKPTKLPALLDFIRSCPLG